MTFAPSKDLIGVSVWAGFRKSILVSYAIKQSDGKKVSYIFTFSSKLWGPSSNFLTYVPIINLILQSITTVLMRLAQKSFLCTSLLILVILLVIFYVLINF